MGTLGSLSGRSEVNKFNFEDESGIGWDHTTGTCCSVSVIGWASEDGLLTLLELSNALIPTTDDLASTDYELQGLAAVVA